MNPIVGYGRWVLSGSWARGTPSGSSITWGRLAASYTLTTVLVALVFVGLAAGGFLGAVTVALLCVPAQVAVVAGLAYAARSPRRID